MLDINIERIISVAESAADLILKAIDPVVKRRRSSSDYTTATDLAVEKFITQELKKIAPGCSVIAEESADLENIPDKEQIFIVDPLDGTINFYHDYRASAVSIAYLRKGLPEMGVVADPYRKEIFYAVSGEGAYLNSRAINVSTTTEIENALAGFGTTPYDKEEGLRMLETASRVYLSCQDLRRLGAAALDLVHVACGRLDFFFERSLKPWDYYAGMLIIQEAGGKCTDWCNRGIDTVSTRHICGTNGILHDRVIKLLNNS